MPLKLHRLKSVPLGRVQWTVVSTKAHDDRRNSAHACGRREGVWGVSGSSERKNPRDKPVAFVSIAESDPRNHTKETNTKSHERKQSTKSHEQTRTNFVF